MHDLACGLPGRLLLKRICSAAAGHHVGGVRGADEAEPHQQRNGGQDPADEVCGLLGYQQGPDHRESTEAYDQQRVLKWRIVTHVEAMF